MPPGLLAPQRDRSRSVAKYKVLLSFLAFLLVAFLSGPFHVVPHIQHLDKPSLSDEDVKF